MKKLINRNVESSKPLPTPLEIKKSLPVTPQHEQTVMQARNTIEAILDGKDKRIFAVVGPCSIHDLQAAHEYAEKLSKLKQKIEDKIFVVMRVYFEKPRTTTGWKGLINDPDLDDSFHIEKGIKIARQLLLDFAQLGLAAGTEALDPIIPQYISELISWTAIGARTTESQTHREMASGLSMPIGFKNGTDGNIEVALNAMKSALKPHHFLGIDQDGKITVFKTRGNRYCHMVLRGGKTPNYSPEQIAKVENELNKNNLPDKIVVDCSHGNSGKDYAKQPQVLTEVIAQIRQGNASLVGVMLESNLMAGRQDIPQDLKQLKYGVSVTDACLDWETTEKILTEAYRQLK
ncbi:MAG: 3-deoxy-7-phosphoheptulonate synthase [Deltaproteobacteria bacterium]|nr:3-deoxy-7-phosphoheptulonate synthase [Deltaproteobacteria bacterium]